ncbi:MAG: hypothetical protein ACKOGL_12035, partial [Acidimicrobiaceae bacterium]
LVLSNSDVQHLISSVEIATDQFEESAAPSTINDYLVSDFSWRVLKIVTGYVGYVNHRVWYKNL